MEISKKVKENTGKKIRLNFFFGIFGQVVTLIIGILIPRLFIVSFGSEVNGFINSMNQVFTYVALLEAGVGAASLQALFKPVSQSNHNKINGILSATNYFYNKTGILYLIAVIFLAVVYPLVVKSNLPWGLMATIVLISGLSSALPYFMQAKYKILLQAEGKEYIISALATTNSILLSSGKLVLLLMGFNVIAVQSLYLALNILMSIVYLVYIKKNYKWINLKAESDREAISQKSSVLVHQFSTLVFNNTDILILTFFCDLNTVSIYVLYRNLISMISTLLNNFLNSINFKLGQTFHEREHFLKLFDAYETFHISLTFSLCTIAYLCITPFMRLYTEGMDIDYIIPYLPLLMIILEILNYARMPSINLVTYSGKFNETKWRSLLETVINLVSSLILVNLIGINGVVLGTILALLYRTNDMIIYGNKHILKRSAWPVYRTWIINITLSTLTVFTFNLFDLELNNYFVLILTAAVLCMIIVPLQITVSYLFNKKAMQAVIEMIKNILLNKKRNGDT